MHNILVWNLVVYTTLRVFLHVFLCLLGLVWLSKGLGVPRRVRAPHNG